MKIVSKQNEKIKFVKKLHEKKFRKEYKLFLVESEKLIIEVYKANYEIVELYVSKTFENLKNVSHHIYEIDNVIMDYISTMTSPSGCLAVVKMKEKKAENDFALVLENLQDPNNIGSIIRTALGAGFDTIYTIDCADPYEPKALRSSMGAIFHTNLIPISYDILENKKGYFFICASMEGENIYRFTRPNEKIALIIGNEGHGVSERLRRLCDKTLSVPMQPMLESLNASVSAGLMMYALKYNLKEDLK